MNTQCHALEQEQMLELIDHVACLSANHLSVYL